MFNDLPELGEFPAAWKRKHLLGLEDLTREELLILLGGLLEQLALEQDDGPAAHAGEEEA